MVAPQKMLATEYHSFHLNSVFDREPRLLFQSAVVNMTRQGGTILDFGGGSGLDAKHYTERGFKVIAYDPAPDMAEHIAQYCGSDVDILSGDFLHHSPRLVDAITANFAVFNLISDHKPIFDAFNRWLSPTGFILVSVLSPYWLRDHHFPWWWRNTVALRLRGHYRVTGDHGSTYRYAPSAIARAARPHFTYEGLLPSSGAPSTSPLRTCKQIVALRRDLFMFVLLRRCSSR